MTDQREEYELEYSDTDSEEAMDQVESQPFTVTGQGPTGQGPIPGQGSTTIKGRVKKQRTAKQIESAKLNLAKARQKRQENKVKKEALLNEKERKKVERKATKKREIVIEEDSYSETDSDYEEEKLIKPRQVKPSKPSQIKLEEEPKLTKAEQKMMLHMEKLEQLVGSLHQQKKAKKRSVINKTVIVPVQGGSQQRPYDHRDSHNDGLKRDLLLDIF